MTDRMPSMDCWGWRFLVAAFVLQAVSIVAMPSAFWLGQWMFVCGLAGLFWASVQSKRGLRPGVALALVVVVFAWWFLSVMPQANRQSEGWLIPLFLFPGLAQIAAISLVLNWRTIENLVGFLVALSVFPLAWASLADSASGAGFGFWMMVHASLLAWAAWAHLRSNDWGGRKATGAGGG